MKRRVFTILSALSLLLFVAVVVLWVRSQWRADFIMRTRWWISGDRAGHTRIWVRSEDGLLTTGYFARSYPASAAGWPRGRAGVPEYEWDASDAHASSASDNLGFAVRSVGTPALTYPGDPFAGYDVDKFVSLPFWPPAVVLALAPLVWLLRRQRSVNPANICRACGYDLRATPERCPECGNPSNQEGRA